MVLIMDNAIKKYETGMPCMLGEAVGRIVGESEKGSWGYINDEKMFSIPLFSTPHGTIIETGVLNLSTITEDGLKKLNEYETQLKEENKELYANKLPDIFPPVFIELTIKKVRFIDKWVEFWFIEDYKTINGDPDAYQLSSKSGYLWNVVDQAGIYDDIMNTGFHGHKITFELRGFNYEILKIE